MIVTSTVALLKISPFKLTKLRTIFLALMVVALMPLILGITLLLSHIFKEQEQHTRMTAIAQARAIVSLLDREFMRSHAVLQTLANHGLWEGRQLAEFHAKARMSAQDLGASSIVMMDSSGQMVISTKRPYGTVLPVVRSAPLLEQTLTTGRPSVSSLFVNPVDRQYIYALSVPLRRNGEAVYALNAVYTPDALDSILITQRLPVGWRAAIIDGQGRIVTRTHEAARFSGRTVLPTLLGKLQNNSEGAYDDITLDGIPVMTAYSKSGTSHWSVVIGIPLEESAASTHAYILHALVLLGLTLFVGSVIIWWLMGYLSKLIPTGSQEDGT